jgi:hypothetical protein
MWIQWSDTNGKDMPAFDTNPQLTGARPWNMNWSDQWVVKVGAELAATKSLELRVRPGGDVPLLAVARSALAARHGRRRPSGAAFPFR